MLQLALEVPRTQIDQLLELVCVELQITDTQYKRAVQSYRAVTDLLDDPEGGLDLIELFPQGSMALGTTVKPREDEEFDVDVVCLVNDDPRTTSADIIYNRVLDRLRSDKTYRDILIPRDRCIRLRYAGQFHMDIIPACPAPKYGVPYGELALVIPEKPDQRQRRSWCSTNPQGFKEWFASKAVTGKDERMIVLSAEPLPANQEAGSKSALQRVTQLSKRRRDVHFEGSDFAPKSILLTTIDGEFYDGEQSLSDALINVLDRLIAMGRSYSGSGVPAVPNPSNPEENLARHWQQDRRHFTHFIDYITVFHEGMQRLVSTRDMERIAQILNELFDPTGTSGAVGRAVKAYTEQFQQARRNDDLRVQKTGAILATAAEAPNAGHFKGSNFWGREQ